MSDLVVIEDESGERAVVSLDAVRDHEARGFKTIGYAVAPGDPRTAEEVRKSAAAEAAADKAIEAKLNKKEK